MKKSFLVIALFLLSFLAEAQNGLQVQSNDKGLFVSHTVAPKETFYSIGRLYNSAPKDIAAFNGLDMNNGLNVGQTVHIPLNNTNFTQKSNGQGIPVFYEVGQSEGLYRVSLKNGNVLMADLRKWNNLATDNITVGQKLIVGYLVSTELQNNAAVTKAPASPQQPVMEVQTVVQPAAKTMEPQRTEPPATKPAPAVVTPKTLAIPGSGYFKGQFEAQSRSQASGKDLTVTSGIFKTASGWQDARYYVLIDKVEPGTIVQISNPTNNKIIFAKVLGEMSGIRQNQGLELRISNAAAAALDITDTEKFIVRVAY